jgi:hypothetical protein
VEQQVAVEGLHRQSRARRRVRRAELDPDPRAVREHHAHEQRVGDARQVDGGHAPRALRVAVGDQHQRVEQRGLDREPGVGIVLGGELVLEQPREVGVAGVDDVERRQPREHLEAPFAIAHLAQRRQQALLGVRQPRVEGDRRQLDEHAPAVVARRVLEQRAIEVDGRGVRRAALRGARPGAQQQRADLGVALRRALQQVAGHDIVGDATGHEHARGLAVQALAFGPREVVGDRDRDQAVGEALAAGFEQAGREQLVARRSELADGDPGHGGDHVRRHGVADHRHRRDDRAVARG